MEISANMFMTIVFPLENCRYSLSSSGDDEFNMKINYGECHCGCGEKTSIAKQNRRNYKIGEPSKYILGHQTRLFPVEYLVNKKTGCWEWQRAKTEKGYGKITVNRRPICAHRFYFEKHKGNIRKGLEIDHLCRNPACVNPDHLEAVTRKENLRRGKSTKLNINQVGEIKDMYKNKNYKIIELSKIFNMSYGCISHIVHRNSWNDVK